MSFDGSIQCWIPDVPITNDNEWRMRVANFGDGYAQRTLDGINALNRAWSMQWINRGRDDLLAMDAFLTAEGASSFVFRDPASGFLYNVFCDDWHIEWSPRRRVAGVFSYFGTLSATFKKANGVAVPGPGSPGTPIQFLLDTFTAPDGTALQSHIGEYGATWAEQIPGLNVGFGRLYDNSFVPAGNPNIYRASAVPMSPNYTVVGSFDFLTDANDSIGICGRMVPGTSEFYLVRWSKTAGNWSLYKNFGSSILLGTYADTWLSGSRYVALDMVGSLIRVVIGGAVVITATDTDIDGKGFPGIWAGAASTPTTGRHLTKIEALPS